MNIVLISYSFWPTIGGIETVSLLLAECWVKKGNSVIVVTSTEASDGRIFPFEIVRNPSAARWMLLLRWADLCFQNNISLRYLWPWLLSKKPVFIAHQTWVNHNRSVLSPLGLIKCCMAAFATNFAISKAIRRGVGLAMVNLVPNPYDDRIFTSGLSDNRRTADFLFVGRLVPDKGCDLFIEALGRLAFSGIDFSATVVGDGPDRQSLEELAVSLHLRENISFRGVLGGRELADCYRAHRVLVIPSKWEEPFGIVALEGIACGCQIVASDGGGLPEVIGSAGRLFCRKSTESLSRALEATICGSSPIMANEHWRREHLASFSPSRIADLYLRTFLEALNRPII